ncbi:ankyrin repeat domain-containing protein SOWAHC [Cuculus canorus]|uniref:ankyrin repeat domain-containing protein SOWAHC n=1 Tax=Cuculus canorus TaxID=55661 RepID=UPI0023AB05F2|nr:ankyrin repeat domain-containing protein SOWAHC [Cuculus canorus]
MAELRQEAVVGFLASRGGRAPNAELLEHFREWLSPAERDSRDAARRRFKELVNAVATVRQEPGTGVKYVHLRRRFCPPEAPRAATTPGEKEEGAAGDAEDAPASGGDAGGRAPPAAGRRGEPPRAGGGQRRGSRRGGEDEEAAAGGGGRRGQREPQRSPQPKRGAVTRGRDSDSASVASEEEGSTGGSVALDPLEHAWMLSASDGRWESLEGLLSCEPALLCKRDFITGFTVLHWAAKHGRQELLATLVNFAQRHRLPVDINARTSGGHTALHIAAMHGHAEVVKLLVGAFDADVDIRDYSGRKAAQYLHQGTSGDMRSLVGALDEEEEEEDGEEGAAGNGSGRWRLSKVLPSNLIGYRLSHHHHHHHSAGDEAEGTEGAAVPGKGKEMARKASGSGRMKPRLNKIRFRTQIIHNTPSFRGDAEEEEQEEKSLKASFKLRPKSNVFG